MSEPVDTNNEGFSKSYKICLFCKTENPIDYQYCTSCGSSLINKLCSNCRNRIPIESIFCPYCGIDLRNSPPIPFQNISYQSFGYPQNYPYVSYQYRPETPKWWHLPVFYIIFCMFGLLIISLFVAVLTIATFGITDISFELSIYLDMYTKLIQLGLIGIALVFFPGLKKFFKPVQEERSAEQPEHINSEIKKQYYGFITKGLFLLLFISVLLVINVYSDLIISFLRNFINFGTPSSSYTFIDENINTYLFLIIFWTVIFAPIHEEILFRGIFQQALNKSVTSDFSHYVLQGITFSFMHLAGDVLNGGSIDFITLHMIGTFTFAICSTYLRKKFNSLIPSIFLHACYNGLSIVFTFISTDYFTADQLDIIYLGILIIPLILIFVILVLLRWFKIWRIKKPLSLQKTKDLKFIFNILVLAFIINISQYAFVILPLEQQALYFLVVGLITLIIFIYWGRKVKDIPWKEFKKKIQN